MLWYRELCSDYDVHGSWVADDIHQPPHCHPCHLSIVVPSPVFWHKRLTACLILVSVTNCLLARCFIRGPQRWQSLTPILLTGFLAGNGSATEAMPTPPQSDLMLLEKLLAGKWFVTDASMKQAPAGCRHFVPVSSTPTVVNYINFLCQYLCL